MRERERESHSLVALVIDSRAGFSPPYLACEVESVTK